MVNQLTEDHTDGRSEVRETMWENIVGHPTYLQNMYLSDAYTFFHSGNIHRQNFRYWSDTTPRETHTEKITICHEYWEIILFDVYSFNKNFRGSFI